MPLLSSLFVRDRQPEVMDQPDLDPAAHHRALRGLARINVWSRSAAALWPVVVAAARAVPDRPLRVLDVATGAGDVPLGLWRRARRAGLPIELAGCDISPTALDHARKRIAAAGADIRVFQQDVLVEPLPAGYDVVTSSLFLHHLTEAEAVIVLKRMKDAAVRRVAVNDLIRSRAGYVLAWVGTRLLTRSPVVHIDGPLSVRAAFTVPELRRLADEAGLSGAAIAPRWPFRALLTWDRG
jgi:2-polyprenyl-3-methyl-5-hydroxy-6-metoxy-1,4-benzoquinol methylase